METLEKETQNGLAVQLTPAQEVEQSLKEKGITQTLIDGLKKYADLKVTAEISEDGHLIVNKDELKSVKIAIAEIRDTRILIEKTCKAQRDINTLKNREILKKEDEYIGVLSPLEIKLQAQKNKPELLQKQIDEENERKQQELFESRVQQLLKFDAKFDGNNYFDLSNKVSVVDLKFMSDINFQSTLEAFKTFYDAEQKRIADEKAENEKALAELKKQRDEQEKERIRLENIQKEQEKKEQELLRKEKEAKDKKFEARRQLIIKTGMVFNGDDFYFAEKEDLVPLIDQEIMENATDEFFAGMISAAETEITNFRKEQKEKREAEIQKAAEQKRRTALLIETGFSFDGNYYFVSDFKRLDPQTIISLNEKGFNDVVKAGKFELERLAKIKEEKRLARQPDKVKLKSYVDSIPVNVPIVLKSAEAKAIHELADKLLNEVVNKLNAEISKL
jgi:hypothetical protein